jgi:ATP-dependent RNA helicase DeaD
MPAGGIAVASFTDLGISPPILTALREMGFEEPTPIQVGAIPPLLDGRDLIGQAQTGTGKTAAYAVPVLQRLEPDVRGPQALVLAPTRELALQVTEEIARIGVDIGTHELAIYGGQPIERQIRGLRAGADIVVGTPGRLLDHLRRGTLRLDHIRMVVLDEGDEMLDMGFIDDIEAILSAAPAERQTALFSATLPQAIQRLATRYLKDPVHVRVTPERLVAPSIEQACYPIGGVDRTEALCRLCDVLDIRRAIVFCRTKRAVDDLAAALQARGYPAEAIHGDMAQPQRNRALSRFREGESELLVATDVAARGLDIEGVTHVVNFHVADSAEAHVHRIGRTGRVGRSGMAITLVDRRDMKQLRMIAEATQTRIPAHALPTPADVARAAMGSFRREIVEVLEHGDLGDTRELAQDLSETYSPLEVAAAAIRMAMDGGRAAPASGPGEPETQRIFINVGHREGVRPADILRAAAGLEVGAIDIHDDFSFAEVAGRDADAAIDLIRQWRVGGRPVNAERARPR